MRTLAAAHTLTADRLRPTFLVLRANTRFWSRSPLPASGWRTSFGTDPAIFQYYPGHGLQLQPLASWGRANAIAGACLAALRSRTRKDRCRSAALARSLDRLSALGARRSGYPRVGVLLRLRLGLAAVGERDDAGDRDPGALARLPRARQGALAPQRPERARRLRAAAADRRLGQRARAGATTSCTRSRPTHRVFNGGLQAVIGLRDASALLHSSRAERLFERGERATRREVADFDTGAWSLYSEHGAEATLNYHSLIAGFLDALCDRVQQARLLQRRPALRALRARADEDRR